MAVIRRALLPRTGEPLENSELEGMNAAIAPPRLLQRLPPALHAGVIRLSTIDHMVEVVTEAGTGKLRLRLCDAVMEMDPDQGLMAHRPH